MVTSITCGPMNPGIRLSVLCVSLTLPPAGPFSRGDWTDQWISSDTGRTMWMDSDRCKESTGSVSRQSQANLNKSTHYTVKEWLHIRYINYRM